MPGDNSCMFYAITYVCESRGRFQSGSRIVVQHETTAWLLTQRKRCAEHILRETENFSELILGEPPEEYVDNLKRLGSWGSATELLCFSQIYQTQILAIDIVNATIYKFPDVPDAKCQTRVFVVYTGNHYDVLAFLPEGSNVHQERFAINDHKALAMALKHAELLHLAEEFRRLQLKRAQERKSPRQPQKVEWKGLGCDRPAPQLIRQQSQQVAGQPEGSPTLRRAASLPQTRLHRALAVLEPTAEKLQEFQSISRANLEH
jgi:hypothetical protein